MNEPVFTADWLNESKLKLWQEHLLPLAGKPKLRFLEIGSYEGRSAHWLLENVLTHSSSRLTCVDIHVDQRACRRFLLNVSPFMDRLTWFRGTVLEYTTTIGPGFRFDFCYIDGCHSAEWALTDLAHIWPRLKVGGIVFLDDYTPKDGRWKVHLAVDAYFGVQAKDTYKVLFRGDAGQAGFQKTQELFDLKGIEAFRQWARKKGANKRRLRRCVPEQATFCADANVAG